MEVLRRGLMIFIVGVLLSTGCGSGDIGENKDNATTPANSYVPPDYPGAEEYTNITEQSSIIWKQSFFYGYMPNNNSIAKFNLNEGKFDKIIPCDFCDSSITALTIPHNTNTLIIFKNRKIKALDLITDTFFDLPDFSLSYVDHYFISPDSLLYGFLDYKNQRIHLYRQSNNGSQLFFDFSTEISEARILRSSINGQYLFAIDPKGLMISIFGASPLIAPTGILYDYKFMESVNLTEITELSSDTLGAVVDARFTSNDNQIIIITDKGYILNLRKDSDSETLIEIKSSSFHLARINTTPDLNTFKITYWDKSDMNTYGVWHFTLNEDMTLNEVNLNNFGNEKSDISECRRPIQILYINSEERIFNCYRDGWIYQNDIDSSKNTFIPKPYADNLNYSSTLSTDKKKLIYIEDKFWGKVSFYSLTNRSEETSENQFLKEFFQ